MLASHRNLRRQARCVAARALARSRIPTAGVPPCGRALLRRPTLRISRTRSHLRRRKTVAPRSTAVEPGLRHLNLAPYCTRLHPDRRRAAIVAAPSSAVRRFASLALARTCADVKPSLRALQLSSPGCGTSTSHPTARNCPTHYLPAPSARPYHVARSPSAQVSVSCAHGHARRSLLRTAPRGRFLVQPCCRCAYAPSFAPLQLPLTLLVGLPVRRAHRPLASTSLSRPLVQYATPRPRVPPSSATSRVRSASSVVAPSRSMYILYTIFVLTPLFSINPFLRAQLRSRRLRTPLSPPTRCSRTHGGSRIYDNTPLYPLQSAPRRGPRIYPPPLGGGYPFIPTRRKS